MRIYRDYWDPTYTSESSAINQKWATFIQPNKRIPFRIPRMRALLNMIYPGTPVSFTEWSAAFAGESDFSTALATRTPTAFWAASACIWLRGG